MNNFDIFSGNTTAKMSGSSRNGNTKVSKALEEVRKRQYRPGKHQSMAIAEASAKRLGYK